MFQRTSFPLISPKPKEFIENEDDFLGFSKDVAIYFVSFEEAKPLLKPEYVEKVVSGEKEFSPPITDVMEAAQDFLDYMVFAWMKAMDERGISASRSITKLASWMRILNRPDIAAILDDDDLYDPYGRPALRKACVELGITYPDYL